MHDGEILKKAIIDKGLSVEECAEKLGKKSRMSMYGYFKSEILSDKIKHQLKKVLNIDIDELKNNQTHPNSKPNQIEKRLSDLETDVKLLKKIILNK